MSNLILAWCRSLKAALKSYIPDTITRDYKRHNRRVFRSIRVGHAPRPKEILCELNGGQTNHIAYSYFVNALAEIQGSTIKGFSSTPIRSLVKRIEWQISRFLNLRDFSVYRSFGTQDFILPNLCSFEDDQLDSRLGNIIRALNTKTDVEDLVVDGVWLGDLIYDSFLKNESVPTVDVTSLKFRETLRDCVASFYFWRRYLTEREVSAVIVSHCVYANAVIMRVALSLGVPAYQISANHLYRLMPNKMFAYNEFTDFPEKFNRLSPVAKFEARQLAQERISRRLSGESGVDMRYSTKTAYGKVMAEPLLKKSKKIKILVATHCFFDSPHSYGKNLFPDFYEWLHFLGRISTKTDYDWYLKTHPDYLPRSRELVAEFVDQYPKFNLLPADCSHHQIISEGIDVALTVYGTIGFEYATLGIPVINASINNPHIAYGFNVHPRSLEEYERTMLDLDSLDLQIDSSEIYEHYYMKHIYYEENIFFSDFEKFLNAVGGYQFQFTSLAYQYWLREFSADKHRELLDTLQSFVRSGDFRLNPKAHINRLR